MTPLVKYDIFMVEVIKMKSAEIKKAKMRLERIRQLMSRVRSPYQGMTKQQIIDQIRKTREKLWEEKFATHSR